MPLQVKAGQYVRHVRGSLRIGVVQSCSKQLEDTGVRGLGKREDDCVYIGSAPKSRECGDGCGVQLSCRIKTII